MNVIVSGASEYYLLLFPNVLVCVFTKIVHDALAAGFPFFEPMSLASHVNHIQPLMSRQTPVLKRLMRPLSLVVSEAASL